MTEGLDPAIVWTLRLSLACLFGEAAYHKLRDPGTFASALGGYQLVPAPLIPAASAGVIASELIVTIGLLLPVGLRTTAAGALGLLALYTAAIVWNLARGRRDVDCGCLGPGRRQRLHPWLVARNLLVAAAPLALLAGSATRTWVWVDGLTMAAGTATAALIWNAANGLATTGRAGSPV